MLDPADIPRRAMALAEKIRRLLDRLDGKSASSWREDMDISIAWRRWMLDTREAFIDPVAPVLEYLRADQYDRAYDAVVAMAKRTGTYPGRNRHIDLHLSSLRTISLVEAGELLGIGRNRCYDLAKRDEFPVPVRSIEGKLRVLVLHVEDYLLGNQ